MRFISLLIVTQNAVLRLKWLSAFLFERYFILVPQQRKYQLRTSTKKRMKLKSKVLL